MSGLFFVLALFLLKVSLRAGQTPFSLNWSLLVDHLTKMKIKYFCLSVFGEKSCKNRKNCEECPVSHLILNSQFPFDVIDCQVCNDCVECHKLIVYNCVIVWPQLYKQLKNWWYFPLRLSFNYRNSSKGLGFAGLTQDTKPIDIYFVFPTISLKLKYEYQHPCYSDIPKLLTEQYGFIILYTSHMPYISNSGSSCSNRISLTMTHI